MAGTEFLHRGAPAVWLIVGVTARPVLLADTCRPDRPDDPDPQDLSVFTMDLAGGTAPRTPLGMRVATSWAGA